VNPTPRFLAVEDVLTLHLIAIEDQGGDASLRDRSLLDAAVAMPRQQFGGDYLHPDIPAMAAAYAFHICKNHPFVDGNKRAATAAMIAFLSDNGWVFEATADDAEPVILQLAAGSIDKPAFTEWARKHMREKPRMELRDFMAQCSLHGTRGLAKSIVASGSETETAATVNEASKAIPLIAELKEAAAARILEGDDRAAYALDQTCVVLVAIYRLAEDMGYEW
jgi:death-on-curing protein